MARARKEYRKLTVSEATNYGMKRAPMLRIQGLWFQEMGFNVGDPVLVKCEEGKLIIMAELKKAEKVSWKKRQKSFSRSSRRKRRNSGQGSWQSVRRITEW